MSNHEIARLFRNVATAYTIKNSKKYYFQIVAYQKASETIEALTTEISDLYKEGKLQELPNIGLAIRSRLEELFKKGSVAHFEAVFKGIPKSVFMLTDIPTIGPRKAYKLATKLALNDPEMAIEDLLTKAKAHEVAKLQTFGEKSEEDILRAISEYKAGKGKTSRMTLPYAAEIADKLIAYMRLSPYASHAVPLGSLRRMMPTIGDIDIAVPSDSPEKVIEHFTSYPYKERVIEEGPTTSSILTSGGKQIDLMVQPPESFGSLLQHFTGSKDHNVKLREYALRKGLSLSEKGIKDLKEDVPIKTYTTEEKFYNALGMSWIPPEIREDKGEINLALSHNLPKLIELSDVKGDLHVHSNFPIEPSHDLGQTNIKEMAKFAQQLKYEYIGFSEHNPSISRHAPSAVYSLIASRNESIDQIQLSIKDVRILKLLEVDILASGKLAIDDKSMNMLDGAIVSIHSSFSMNKTEMTKRVLAGLSHPKAIILAHPTGRMLNERSGYELDFDKIFDFCKTNNKALEINSWTNRLDLPDSLVREAVSNGVKLVINTDSHAVSQMTLMKYGVAVARRGWATKSDIINTLTYEELITWLSQMQRG